MVAAGDGDEDEDEISESEAVEKLMCPWLAEDEAMDENERKNQRKTSDGGEKKAK